MLTYFTDAVTQDQIAINPSYVVAVFTAQDGEMKGKTVIGLTNGNVIVEQTLVNVVGIIQGQL